MQNDPVKWTNQTWVIPMELETRIVREKENWYVELFAMGPRFLIDARQAEMTVEAIERYRAEQWKLRRRERD